MGEAVIQTFIVLAGTVLTVLLMPDWKSNRIHAIGFLATAVSLMVCLLILVAVL